MISHCLLVMRLRTILEINIAWLRLLKILARCKFVV